MKNIKLLIIIMCIVFLRITMVYSQENSFDKIAELGLPKGLLSLNNEQQKDFMSKRSKSAIDLKMNKGNIYKLGDIAIQVSANSAKVEKNAFGVNTTWLEDTKNVYDEYNPQIITQKKYNSEIKMINNGKVLIINFDRTDNYSQYLINAVNTNNDKTIIIRIEYKKEDEVKAATIVDHILKNMRFK